MCWKCFKQYTTDAPVVNDRVLAAFRLMEAHNEPSSQLLHVIVEDMNVGEDEFDRVHNASLRQRYNDAPPAEQAIFDALAELSVVERATAVAMQWGFILPDGSLRADLAESDEPTDGSNDDDRPITIRPFAELSKHGLLWLINATVFHPRGFSLALCVDTPSGEAIGWDIRGDGSEAWVFTDEISSAEFDKVEAFFDAIRRGEDH